MDSGPAAFLDVLDVDDAPAVAGQSLALNTLGGLEHTDPRTALLFMFSTADLQ